MWPRRPETLKQALRLAMATLVVVSGLAISLAVTHRFSRLLLQEAQARGENIAHNLSLDAADRVLINDLVGLQKLLDDRMAGEPAIAYLFVVRDGRILTHTFDQGVPVQLIEANHPTDSQVGRLEKLVSQKGERFLDFAWPILQGEAGTLRLGLSERPYRRQVLRLWGQMGLVTLAVLILALGTTSFFLNRLTRPLASLASAAASIDEARLESRLPAEGRAEVRALAEAFNGLLDRLAEHQRRLTQINAELEAKNRELDRAHRQMQTSFTIAREVAALSSLDELGRYLVATLRNIVECQRIVPFVLGDDASPGFFLQDRRTPLPPALTETFRKALHSPAAAPAFIDPRDFQNNLPPALQATRQLALFPLRPHGELLGGLVIGCPGSCRCVTQELELIALVLDQVAGGIRRALQHEDQIRALQQRLGNKAEFGGMIGRAPQMQVVYRLIDDVAPTDATVLILGESGTGKELAARAIHHNSARAQRPFVVINCAAYPSTLLESELFGHEKGAFTGALKRKPGRFEQADGGTVFLDEIGEIPATAQIRLLRVLQSQKFERLGGEATVEVNVRILTATHRDLMEEVKAGRFREDLYYRLNVVPIRMPPLRERRNDIPLLSQHFLERFAGEQGKPLEGFSPEALRGLMQYPWPGNVRELENSVEHATVLAKGKVIELADLPEPVVASLRPTAPAEAPPPKAIVANEERLVREVLEECDWNKTAAAERLGISRSTLYQKLKRYGISRPTLH